MIGRRGRFVIACVAGIACLGYAGVLTSRMALLTCNRRVRTRQGEAGDVVVELRPFPVDIGVACQTIRRKARAAMIRVGRAIEVSSMAGKAICRSSLKRSDGMTGGA
jgi:hypothetical protein